MLIVPPVIAAEPPFQQPTDAFEPAECMFETPFFSFISPEFRGFECGYVTVPEQHANPNGPTIRLPVAILKAQSENRRPDPLFLAQGGPGGDAFAIFSFTMPESSVARDRDLVIFNQRGTLYAEPNLLCTEVFEARPELLPLSPAEATQREVELITECYRRLQAEGVNLSAFNSLENAADIDAIREALGYENINFYGVSYGTLLALHLMRNHPEHLRSVIIDGVVPTQLNFVPLVPQNRERIYSEIFRTCATDPICRTEYPDLETRFFALVNQLNQQPTTLSLTDSESGVTADAFLDGDSLVDVMFQIFYLSDAYAIFPKVVNDIESGDYSFLQYILPLLVFDDTFSDGMYYSVLCAEDADFDPDNIPLDGVRPEFAKNVTIEMQEYLDICRLWPVDLLPPTVDDPVESDIPTLVLSGQFDPITPPAFADAAAEYLPNSYSFVDPTASHGTMGSDFCVDRIVQDFLDNPTVEPDSFCLTENSPTGFVPNNVIRVALIGDLLGQLETGAVAQVGLAGLFLGGVLSAFLVWPLVFIINLIRKKKAETTSPQKWVRRLSAGLVILFSGLAIIFVSGLTTASFYVITTNINLLVLSSLPGWSAPLFIIPWLLGLLALGMIVATVFVWQSSGWSIWGRLYYTFLTLCAISYVVVLSVGGMMTVLV